MIGFKKHFFFNPGLALAFALLTLIGWRSFRNTAAMNEAGRRDIQKTIRSVEVGGLLCLAFLFLVFALLRREMARRRRAEQVLS